MLRGEGTGLVSAREEVSRTDNAPIGHTYEPRDSGYRVGAYNHVYNHTL